MAVEREEEELTMSSILYLFSCYFQLAVLCVQDEHTVVFRLDRRKAILLLKMNYCLQHIDYSLRSPTNTLVTGKYASRAV
jgi:hypothetical protein